MSASEWERVCQRWFAWDQAFDHPVVVGVVAAVAVLIVVAGVHDPVASGGAARSAPKAIATLTSVGGVGSSSVC